MSIPERIMTIAALQAHVGREIGVGEWLAVTQARIDAFADVTGDHQWIHVDPARCVAAGRGGTIAHGYLTLSLLPFLQQSLRGVSVELPLGMALNYGSDRIRFITPVPAGGRIRLRALLLALDPVGPDVWQAKYRHTVELEDAPRPALVAETLSRLILKSPPPAARADAPPGPALPQRPGAPSGNRA